MPSWLELIVTVFVSVLSCSGLWAYIQKRTDRNDAGKQMLIGLGHDRIIYLGMTYIKRGYITKDEYENLHDYLYKPYAMMGGNGTAKRVMDEVDKLPVKPEQY